MALYQCAILQKQKYGDGTGGKIIAKESIVVPPYFFCSKDCESDIVMEQYLVNRDKIGDLKPSDVEVLLRPF